MSPVFSSLLVFWLPLGAIAAQGDAQSFLGLCARWATGDDAQRSSAERQLFHHRPLPAGDCEAGVSWLLREVPVSETLVRILLRLRVVDVDASAWGRLWNVVCNGEHLAVGELDRDVPEEVRFVALVKKIVDWEQQGGATSAEVVQALCRGAISESAVVRAASGWGCGRIWTMRVREVAYLLWQDPEELVRKSVAEGLAYAWRKHGVSPCWARWVPELRRQLAGWGDGALEAVAAMRHWAPRELMDVLVDRMEQAPGQRQRVFILTALLEGQLTDAASVRAHEVLRKWVGEKWFDPVSIVDIVKRSGHEAELSWLEAWAERATGADLWYALDAIVAILVRSGAEAADRWVAERLRRSGSRVSDALLVGVSLADHMRPTTKASLLRLATTEWTEGRQTLSAWWVMAQWGTGGPLPTEPVTQVALELVNELDGYLVERLVRTLCERSDEEFLRRLYEALEARMFLDTADPGRWIRVLRMVDQRMR